MTVTPAITAMRHWLRLTQLRWSLLTVEVLLLIVWADGEPLPWLCWFALLGQLLQQIISVLAPRLRLPITPATLTFHLVLDVTLLSCLLYATGGATNAYVSALLLPIALAGVMLTGWQVMVVLVAAIAGYSSMVFWLPLEIHHIHDMQSHFVGMWVNFLLSALVVVFVVAAIARELRQRDAQLAQQQLAALRQQQLLAMGTAAAQTVHDMATPIATLGLLQEELTEQDPNNPDVQAMSKPLEQCQQSLASLRQLAAELRQQKVKQLAVADLANQLIERCRLMWPEVNWQSHCAVADSIIEADNSLLPALLNIMQNAAGACAELSSAGVEMSDSILTQDDGRRYWQLQIKNPFAGDRHQLQQAGEQLVSSAHGFGMALMLSRSVIERFGGTLTVSADGSQNEPQEEELMMAVSINLPLAEVSDG
ncbi:sensor histidine kinase [Neiella marina]|uniref:histidine kinase n=1 Tax=Neiella holothuriorum TaxID=2870530 RepID=A0ABS7EC12_9GAMM|nr:sensor histidine kinase [Neiella holothuriorum]MBW8189867.1 sensor histidine kinase [Neiella holothuriorum]